MRRALLKFSFFVVVIVTCTFYLGCGGSKSPVSAASQTNPAGTTGSATPTTTTAPTAATPTSHHIFIMSEENPSYGSVIGNTSQMPYINSLLSKGTLWTNFYANQHGSMHGYIETMSGTAFNCSGNDCGASGALTGPSLMDLMNAKGMAWKGYFDGLSSCGQLAPRRRTGSLIRIPTAHRTTISATLRYPWYAVGTATISQLSDGSEWLVADEPVHHRSGEQILRILNWITPDGTSDGHDGTLTQMDAFMAKWLPQLLASSYFQPGGDGILIIWWDEAALSDVSCGGPDGTSCGGRIP